MTNIRFLAVLSILALTIPRPASSHASLGNAFKIVALSSREPHDEPDAQDEADCLALGELDIAFRTFNNGPPNVGVVLTDPRGRRIGFDPLTRHAWQELPEAQGFIDCDALDNRDSCRGMVQVCGPVTGTYELEVIAKQPTAYILTISGRSEEVPDVNGLRVSLSQAGLNRPVIRKGSRDLVLVKYSRDPATKVVAQLQASMHALGYRARLHKRRHIALRGAKSTNLLPNQKLTVGD